MGRHSAVAIAFAGFRCVIVVAYMNASLSSTYAMEGEARSSENHGRHSLANNVHDECLIMSQVSRVNNHRETMCID